MFYVPGKRILAPQLYTPGNKPARALRTVSSFDGEFYPFFAEHGTKSTVDAASGEFYANAGTITHNGDYITVATANTNYALLKPHLSLSAFSVIIKVRNVSGSANNRIWSHKEVGADDLRIFVNGLNIYFDADDGSFTRLSTSVSSWADWVTIAVTHTGSYQKLFLAEGNHTPLEIVDESGDTLIFNSATGEQVFFGALSTGTPGAMGGDGEYVCFVPDRAMSDDEVIEFAAEPYAVLDVGPQWIPISVPTGGAGFEGVGLSGSLALAGASGDLQNGQIISGSSGSISLSVLAGAIAAGQEFEGSSAALSLGSVAGQVAHGQEPSGTAGSISLTPTAGQLVNGFQLTGTATSLTLTGQPGDVTTTGGFEGIGIPGSLTLINQTGQLVIGNTFVGSSASLSLTGASGVAHVGIELSGQSATLTLTGQAGVISIDKQFQGIGQPGAIALSGVNGILQIGSTFVAIAGQLTLSGAHGVVDVSGGCTTITFPEAAAVSISLSDPESAAGVVALSNPEDDPQCMN